MFARSPIAECNFARAAVPDVPSSAFISASLDEAPLPTIQLKSESAVAPAPMSGLNPESGLLPPGGIGESTGVAGLAGAGLGAWMADFPAPVTPIPAHTDAGTPQM
jgi:hypothetical protein